FCRARSASIWASRVWNRRIWSRNCGIWSASGARLLFKPSQRSILAARVVWPWRLPFAGLAGIVVSVVTSVLISFSLVSGLSYGAVPHGRVRSSGLRNAGRSPQPVSGYNRDRRLSEEGPPAWGLSSTLRLLLDFHRLPGGACLMATPERTISASV